MPGFWGFFSFFLARRDARVVGRCGFWGLRGGAAGFWAWVRWRRFVRICPDFGIFGRLGAGEGMVLGRWSGGGPSLSSIGAGLGPACLAWRARWPLAPRLACLAASLLVPHSFFQEK